MGISLFGLTFHPYGFILGLGILAAFEASLRLAKARKIERKTVERLFVWVVAGGIIGARVYHVIDKWSEIYSLNPVSSFYLWNGGLGIWGAVIGGIVGLYLFLQKTQELPPAEASGLQHLRAGKTEKNQNYINYLDVVLFGVPLGQAIGRWGNFFNNEIVGKNGEPLFLYESILDLVLFGVLMSLRGGTLTKQSIQVNSGSPREYARDDGRSGLIAGAYLVGYGLIRLILEPLRPESIIWTIGDIPTASLVSAAAILLGSNLIFRRRF